MFWRSIAGGAPLLAVASCVLITDLPPEEAVGGSGAGGTGSTGGACSANLATDPNHCGACDHACDAGCTAGVCEPVTIASGQSTPRAIAVDNTYVYWLNSGGDDPCPPAGGTLVRIPKSGGNVETLVDALGCPWALKMYDGNLYVVERGAPFRLLMWPLSATPQSGEEVEMATFAGDSARFLDVDDDAVYVTDFDAGAVYRVPHGGTQIPIDQGSQVLVNPSGVVAYNQRLYVTDEGTADLSSYPLGGPGAPAKEWAGAFVDNIPSGATSGTWRGEPGIFFCSGSVEAGGPEAQLLFFAPGSAAAEVLQASNNCRLIWAREDVVIWTEERTKAKMGSVLEKHESDDQPTVYSKTEDDPYGITSDGERIYWTNAASGTIRSVVR